MQVQADLIPLTSTQVSYLMWSTSWYNYNIYKSSSPGEMMKAIESLECPLGTEMLAGGPRSSSSLGSESWGRFWSVLSSDIWLWWSSSTSALRFSSMAFSGRGVGAAESRGASVSHTLLSLFFNHYVRVTLLGDPSLAMEMSLMSQPSNHREDGHGWESPPVEERLSCLSSSSCIWSSQIMGGDWVTSIASLKAICWVSAFFDISLCSGQGGIGNF